MIFKPFIVDNGQACTFILKNTNLDPLYIPLYLVIGALTLHIHTLTHTHTDVVAPRVLDRAMNVVAHSLYFT